MEPIYPVYEDDYEEDDLREIYIEAATRLTCAAMKTQLVREGSSAEETVNNVLLFFETAFRRIRDISEEDDDYLEDIEENGEHDSN